MSTGNTFEDLFRRAAEGPGAMVVVSLDDLMEANRAMFETMRRELFASIPSIQNAQYMTRDQVCDMLGVSLKTLYSWDKKGILRAERIGGCVRYKSKDVTEKLNLRTKK